MLLAVPRRTQTTDPGIDQPGTGSQGQVLDPIVDDLWSREAGYELDLGRDEL